MFERIKAWPATLIALLLQISVFVLLTLTMLQLRPITVLPVEFWVIVQAMLTSFFSRRLEQPSWWSYIHLVFPVGLYVGLHSNIAPEFYLAAFVLLISVFWNSRKDRVPLYLSNKITQKGLYDYIFHHVDKAPMHLLDAGAGVGSIAKNLASPIIQTTGIETAPLPYLIAKLRCGLNPNVRILREDLWQHDFSQYDVVYAFLSPEPMPKLWKKVEAEMQTGALFISNSFPVPDIQATEIVELKDRRKTKLYIYKRL